MAKKKKVPIPTSVQQFMDQTEIRQESFIVELLIKGFCIGVIETNRLSKLWPKLLKASFKV